MERDADTMADVDERAETDAAPAVVGGQAPDATLPDQDGVLVTFAALWARQPTVFVFLRHFG